jgi:EmrB/QacA subfamily drug resistance transporter
MSSVTTPATRPKAADHRWLLLVIVATAQLMVVLDATIVNIALPSAQKALGFSNDNRQWIVTAYALAFGSLLLLGGRLGDVFGRKWAFLGGMAGFAISSAVGGAAQSFSMLVTARAFQGVFGALLAPAVLSTLVRTFTDPRERAKAFGIFGAVASGGGAVGLVLGGVLTEYLSWRWCLYVNLGFAALAGLGALKYMQNERPAVRPPIDFIGVGLASMGLFALVFGFSRAETAGWSSPVTLTALAIGVVLLAVFVAAERKISNPLLPLKIITDRTRGGSYLSVGIAGIAIFGAFLFLAYYLQVVKHFSPVTAGLAFLPMMACIFIASTTSNIVLLPRVGPRVLLTSGMTLGGLGMFYLSRLSPTDSYVGGVLPGLILLGFGFGSIMAPAISTATLGVAPKDAGVASAMVNTMQQIGGSVGTAVLSTLAASATATYISHHAGSPSVALAAATHGYTVAFATAAGLFALGAIMAFFLMPPRRLHLERQQAINLTVQSPEPVAAHA